MCSSGRREAWEGEDSVDAMVVFISSASRLGRGGSVGPLGRGEQLRKGARGWHSRVPELTSSSGGPRTGQRKGGKLRLPHSRIWSVLHGVAASKSSSKTLQIRRSRHLKVDST
jgi:hypothetical protein